MESPPDTPGLVPGRDCGACTLCCTVLPIATPEFAKPPGITCAHCIAGAGCGIYETRFAICRAYQCGWRRAAGLGEDWRPDRSGILIDEENSGIPTDYPVRPGVRFIVLGGADAVRNPELTMMIGNFAVDRVPMFLTVPGPPGRYAARSFLNDALAPHVEARSLPGIAAVLIQAYDSLKDFPFQPAPG